MRTPAEPGDPHEVERWDPDRVAADLGYAWRALGVPLLLSAAARALADDERPVAWCPARARDRDGGAVLLVATDRRLLVVDGDGAHGARWPDVEELALGQDEGWLLRISIRGRPPLVVSDPPGQEAVDLLRAVADLVGSD